MAIANITLTKEYISEECCNCGVIFFMTNSLNKSFRNTKKTFYCPNGHGQSYSESTEDKLNRDIMYLNNKVFNLERENTALKAKKTRKK